jgi:DNA-binding response OmpR family regulator
MKRILIIEDEPDVAKTIKMYLEEAGYDAEYTLKAVEGVDKLKDFDLLLLDLIMPKVSGRAVLRMMEKKGIKKPVIVLSAVGLPKVMSEELSNEFPGIVFIPKTSMYAQLLPAIKTLMGK